MNKFTILGLLAAVSLPTMAQEPQIPTLQVCDLTNPATGMPVAVTVASTAALLVHIPSRVPGGFTGNVTVNVSASCDPNTGFPVGALTLSALSMNDTLPGLLSISSVHIDQITSTGTVNPTAYMSGQCLAQTQSAPGTVATVPCHFWILFVSGAANSTNGIPGPDIVSFLVFANTSTAGAKAGTRIAYATGPVTSGGTIQVSPTPN
jgi:hypothetical protein